MKPLLLLTDERMLAHDPGHEVRGEHPECPGRLGAILDALENASIEGAERRSAPPCPREAIERVHPAGYVDRMDGFRGRSAQIDPDTGTSPGSIEAAYLAAGAVVAGVDAVLDQQARCAFALVRPPGHHAEPDRSMGFCLFSNLAIGVEHARSRGVGRILIVDWDVHHGNGTQAAFYGSDEVLFFDTHQSPLYPGTGALSETGRGRGEGYTINVPLAPGTGDADYLEVFERVLVPVARAFEPELVFVSAGFDAHREDPLGAMRLTDEGFANLCTLVRAIADQHADGRMILSLEGGYALDALARSVLACAGVLATPGPVSVADPAGGVDGATGRIVDALIARHGAHWPILSS